MKRQAASSPAAIEALKLLESLQTGLVNRLSDATQQISDQAFEPVTWFRQGGTYGGGCRYVATNEKIFNRASVNVSQVQYEQNPDKSLNSATALSTIIHPHNPWAPSLHLHISWTELKSQKGYWRIMADLNPSIKRKEDKTRFDECLEHIAPEVYEQASAQGNKYFYIPALKRHRGVSHFYLENYHTEKPETDYQFAKAFGEQVTDVYSEIMGRNIAANPHPSAEDFAEQLAYHTLYFFQVLTLDRGTTSGLLVHNDNDVGTLGSLPAKVDRDRLCSYLPEVAGEQRILLSALIDCLDDQKVCAVDEETKRRLAQAMRAFYAQHPKATELLASGDIASSASSHHTR